MSRPLKLICCAVVLATGGGVAIVAAASAHPVSHMIVCPLDLRAGPPPCCGPPLVATTAVIPCCGSPEPVNCPVGLTAGSSRDPSTAGQRVTITGSSGDTAGQTVELWQKVAGAKNFSKVATTTTGSLGTFQFVEKGVETNRKWYVSAGSTKSATIDQAVKAVVTVVLGRHLHGHVTPNQAGEWVWLERQDGSRWRVIVRRRLSRQSTFAFAPFGCGSRGRVVFPGDRRNMQSASREVVGVCGTY